jgi:hypothetical protein
MSAATFWYDDNRFVAGLPIDYRLFAKSASHAVDRKTDQIPLGYPLFRWIGLVRKFCHLSSEVRAPIGELTIVIDLSDPRAPLVHEELSLLMSHKSVRKYLSPIHAWRWAFRPQHPVVAAR